MKFPDLSSEKVIAIDIETKDPGLKTKGPGVYRNDGEIVGFSLATPSGFAEYYDLAHPGSKDVNPQKVLSYLKEVLKLPIKKVGANLLYDFDWLIYGYGMEVKGDWIDIQIAEALIDENQGSYSLDALSKKYGVGTKQESKLNQWAGQNGVKEKDIKSSIYKMPYSAVYEYGKADAVLPIEIFKKQWPQLKELGLTIGNSYSPMSLLDIEMKLLPVLLKMRSFGCRVSVERLNSLESRMETELHRLNKEIDVMAKGVNYNSPMQVKEFLKHQGVEIPAVQKKDAYGEFVARESVAKDVLMQIDHPFAKKVLEIRVVDKLLNTFVRGAIKENLIGDRIHARFHPMVSDSYGAKTGRLSMSDPSLHQIPTRDAHWGKLIRGLFIPEEGCEWGKVDYSQIEPRLLAHDAVGASGEMVRTQYAEDPYKDYHQMTADLAGIDRKPAKTVNLGLTYGMGKEKLRREMMNLGHSAEDADALMSKYHEALPYIRETSDAMRKSAERLGYIKTILGRYRRFPDRSHARKAANARFQGSSADIMKKALVDLDATGLIDQGRIALTVHDEVDGSFPIGKREVIEEVQRVMETVVKLRVPLIAEPETGISWGEVKKIKESS